MASPKVLVKNRILFPSCDQSARSPNHATWVMCGGKWSAGFSPGVGSAAGEREATTMAIAAIERNGCAFMVVRVRFEFVPSISWVCRDLLSSFLRDCKNEVELEFKVFKNNPDIPRPIHE